MLSRLCKSPNTRFDNSKAPDFHLLENVDTHAVKCEDQTKVASEGEGQPGGIQSDPGEGQSFLGEKLEDGQSTLRERSSRGQDGGYIKTDGTLIEGS